MHISTGRRVRSRLLAIALVATTLGFSTAPTTAQSSPGTPTDLGCTIWRTSGQSPTTPKECTYSSPWWTSFADCPMSPVHATPGPRKDLAFLPWVQVEPASLGIVAYLFFGNRPLAANGTFAGGASPKVLWVTDPPASDLTITAANLNDPGSEPIAMKDVTRAIGPSGDWPSYLRVPTAGCWTFTVSASRAGQPITGSLVYIAV